MEQPPQSVDSSVPRSDRSATEISRLPVPTRLGILSDTHGDAARARRAVELLCARGATQIIHLGDVGCVSVLDHLAGVHATVVFGNCDDARSLWRYAESLGIAVAHPAAIIEVKSSEPGSRSNVRVGITHGHLLDEVDRLFQAEVDILLHGHTHAIRDDIVGSTRILNPGALHRATRRTALLLELPSGEAEWIDVDA